MTDLAFYLPSLAGGGAERAMVNLANSFAEKGLAVDLVVANATGPYLAEVEQAVRTINLETPRVSRSLPKLIRYISEKKPGLLISSLNYANVIAVLAVFLSGAPTKVFVTERTTLSRSLASTANMKSWLLRMAMRVSYRRADGVIAVSKGVAEDLARTLGIELERVSVVYNPVVTPDLFRLAAQSIEHPWLNTRSIPVVLAVGRLTAAKDYPTLLRSFALMRSRIECRLIVLGDGECRAELLELVRQLGISDCVDFPGFVENPFAWMSKSSLFVLSSAWEGLPNSLIQAMACGIPVVSTDCESGPREILQDGRWGALVPVGDEHALCDAMEIALSTKARPSARQRAEQFSAEASVARYSQVLGIK